MEWLFERGTDGQCLPGRELSDNRELKVACLLYNQRCRGTLMWKKANILAPPLCLDLNGRVPAPGAVQIDPKQAPPEDLVDHIVPEADDAPAPTGTQEGFSQALRLVNATARAVCLAHRLLTDPEEVAKGGAPAKEQENYLAVADSEAIKEFNKCKLCWVDPREDRSKGCGNFSTCVVPACLSVQLHANP